MTTEPTGSWDDAYRRAEPPPWDIGRPQAVFAGLAEQGLLSGDVLDAGCGTGEHSVLAARGGASVVGVDLSPVAIEAARAKAQQAGVDIRFEAGDILALDLPASAFDAAIDSGLFHSFDDAGRARYVDVIARSLRDGGRFYLMCFSDRQPGDWGPRRISRGELESSFASGWDIERLEPARFEINPMPDVPFVDAWLLVARRDVSR